MSRDAALAGVLEREGVVGCFAGDDKGDLVLDLMPSEFRPPVLRRTLFRLSSIVRCATSCGLRAEDCELTLGDRRLLLRRFGGGMLCVLVGSNANRGDVRAAMRVATGALQQWLRAGALGDAEDDTETTTRYIPQPTPRASSAR